MTGPPVILLAVTADRSLTLMSGLPEHLAAKGWAVHVASAPGPHLNALRELPTITAHSVPMSRNPHPFRDIVSLVSWIRLLRSVQPDVLSSGTPKAGLLGMMAGWLTRVPVRVYVLRGLRLESIPRGMIRRLLHLLEWVTARCSTAVVAVSPSLVEQVVALRLVAREKVHVLGSGSSNGVEVERFAAAGADFAAVDALRDSLELARGIPVIGFVGRLTADKGLLVFAAARGQLVRRGVDHQLLLIGGLDGGVHNDLLGELLSIGRPAVATGHVQDTSLYYPLMDVLCLPTLREGFPNVVLEAAAAGVPTVTTTATGAIDAVVDGETGFIAEVGDADELARCLERVLILPKAQRQAMGRAAQERAIELFSRSVVRARYADFYTAQYDSHQHEAST